MILFNTSISQVEAAEAAEEGDAAAPGGEMETTVEILRILGNLCYDCPDGRAQLLRSKCLEHVLAVARDRAGGARAKSGDPGQRFPVILPGFLLNFCNDNKGWVHESSLSSLKSSLTVTCDWIFPI